MEIAPEGDFIQTDLCVTFPRKETAGLFGVIQSILRT